MNNTDPRGPMRRIAHIDRDASGHPFITTDCGHTYSRNGTFSYAVGEPLRCMVCLENAVSLTPASTPPKIPTPTA